MLFGKQKNCFENVNEISRIYGNFCKFWKAWSFATGNLLKELESLVCKRYGFKNLSLVNEVRKCLNLSKYDKEMESSDL